MFDFLKSSKNNALEDVLARLDMNMSNNYKDAAQSNLKEFEQLFKELKDSGKLNEKQKLRYESLLNEYREKMKNYSHKDQKPYWVQFYEIFNKTQPIESDFDKIMRRIDGVQQAKRGECYGQIYFTFRIQANR